jgi:hypothetical protein
VSIAIVKKVVERFLTSQGTEVLAIKGSWGVGKSHAWRELVESFKNAIQPKTYAYVSLFGINSLAELRVAILANSQATKTIGTKFSAETIFTNPLTWLNARANWVLQKARWADGGPGLKNIVVGLDLLTPSLITDRLICFDDFERVKLPSEDVLGFISTLKETAGCKAVLILNDEQLSGEQRAAYQKYREKVIDDELHFEPDVADALLWADTDKLPYSQEFKERVTTLDIKNVRILRRAARTLNTLAPLLAGRHPQVISETIQSIVLLTWCYYDKADTVPSLEFLKATTLTSDIKRKLNKNEVIDPREAAWGVLLSHYGWRYYDQLDAGVLQTIEQGFREGTDIEKEIERRDASYKSGDVLQQFIDAFDFVSASFAPNQSEVVEKIVAGFKASVAQQSPGNLNGAVIFLRELDENTRADDLIECYVASRAPNPKLFDLSKGIFGADAIDPGLSKAFAAVAGAVTGAVTLRQAAEQIAGAKGWSAEEQAVLSRATANDLYDLLKRELSLPVSEVVLACRRFNQPPDQHIAQRTDEALMRIGCETKLNAVRVRRYGIDVKQTTAPENGPSGPSSGA